MKQRPLSPHVQIYRLPITAVLSILHRVTGVLLTFGMVVAVLALVCFAGDRDSFPWIQSGLNTGLGRALTWAWLYALFLHLCHGLRHLIWDSGRGFEHAGLNRHAGYALVGSFLLTGACYLISVYGP